MNDIFKFAIAIGMHIFLIEVWLYCLLPCRDCISIVISYTVVYTFIMYVQKIQGIASKLKQSIVAKKLVYFIMVELILII